MSPQTEEFTVGVEEAYQIINPQTRQLCARSQLILPTAQSLLGDEVAKPEFRQSQIEVATPICRFHVGLSDREMAVQAHWLVRGCG